MRQMKVWVFAALVGTAVGGFAVMNTVERQAQAAPERGVDKDYWRNHEGHWSYWNAADRRWYYTDGTHWFFHNGKAWTLYPFDKKFGREGFEHGAYKVPGKGVKVVVPHHEVYLHR